MHEVGDARRARVHRDRRKLRPVERQIGQDNASLACQLARKCDCCRGCADAGRGAHHGDALARVTGVAQRLGDIGDGEFVRGRCGSGGFHRRLDRCLRNGLGADEALRQPAPLRHRLCRRCDDRFGHRLGHRFNRDATAIDIAAEQFARGNEPGGDEQGRKRCDQHDRHLLREERRVRHHGARDGASVARGRTEAVARCRLAILGEIGLEQITLRLGLALERAQLDVLSVGRCRLHLELVERALQEFDACARDARIVLERTRKARCLVADLAVEIVDLRLQLLDARMVVEQRGRLFGKLGAQRHALLVEPPDDLGIDHVGIFDRSAALEHIDPHLGGELMRGDHHAMFTANGCD